MQERTSRQQLRRARANMRRARLLILLSLSFIAIGTYVRRFDPAWLFSPADVAKWMALAFGLGSICLYLGSGSAAWTRPSIRKVFLFHLAMMTGCCGLFALAALPYGTIKFIATAFLLLGAVAISVVVCRMALPMLKDAAEEVRVGAKRMPAGVISQYVLASVAISTYVVWRLALYAPATPQVVALPREQDRSSPYMRVFGVAQPPYGYLEFCKRMPEECAVDPREEHRFSATPERLTELDALNRAVNHEIAPATDMEIYGVDEYWTIPTTRGDTEDYALLKRKRLMARGWPTSSLLITVVRDEVGEGHAVLTVHTMQGDFILDNKVDEVKTWNRTPYAYLTRQSNLDTMIWMSLDPHEMSSTPPIAGARSEPGR
jgi:predicted transglutaminase-like cysteine proteinase